MKPRILLLSCWVLGSLAQNVLVSTPRGDILGVHVDYGSNTSDLYYGSGDLFLGIPYAEPPVGEKRFQKTIPLCTYPQNPYNATFMRSSCPQLGDCAASTQSEDCLYLNVFTPNANSVYKYPVMVYIHGGSMTTGCAHQYPAKGAVRNLVSRGVVVVTLQYRLGLIGFFTTFTDEFPPNRGMLDQVEAIRWVADNIQYFGGNPYKITLFGESAGGASVSAHTYSPLSQGLFQQAIMESGVTLTSFEGSLGFTNFSETRASELCNFTDAQWQANDWAGLKDCLMSKQPADFVALEGSNVFGWKICQDNYFFPGVPRDLAKQRANIPVLLGNMRDEFSLYLIALLKLGIFNKYMLSQAMFESLFDEQAGFLNTRLIDVQNIMEKVYTPPNTGDSDIVAWFKAINDVFTAAGFTGFILREIDNYMAMGNQEVYVYEQTYSSKVGRPWNDSIVDFLGDYKPVPHVAEIYFIWMQESIWSAALSNNEVIPFDYNLADWYGSTWTNFAKYGRPFLSNDWSAVPARGNNTYFQIDQPDAGGMQMRLNYRYVDDIAWTKVLPALSGDIPPIKPDYNNGTNPLPSPTALRARSLVKVCPNDKPDVTGTCQEAGSTTTMTASSTTASTATRTASSTGLSSTGSAAASSSSASSALPASTETATTSTATLITRASVAPSSVISVILLVLSARLFLEK